jgi:hypothetical protein
MRHLQQPVADLRADPFIRRGNFRRQYEFRPFSARNTNAASPSRAPRSASGASTSTCRALRSRMLRSTWPNCFICKSRSNRRSPRSSPWRMGEDRGLHRVV